MNENEHKWDEWHEIIEQLAERDQRITEMAALLNQVPHKENGFSWPCNRDDCIACAWAAKKKEWGL